MTRHAPMSAADIAHEVQHLTVLDVNCQLVQQHQVVDGGIVGLHVRPQHEAVVLHTIADLAHGILGTAVALEVGAAA